MQDSDTLNALIGAKVFGFTAIGYYGPPRQNETVWEHDNTVLYPTKAEAEQRYHDYIVAKYGGLRGPIDADDEASLCYWKEGYGPIALPEYCTHIADAWKVVEKLGMVTIENQTSSGPWCVSFTCHMNGHDCAGHWLAAEADSISLAICLAALKAIGEPRG